MLSLTSLGLADELQALPVLPQPLPAAHEQSHERTALEHLRKAAEHFEAAGLAEEAQTLRGVSEQLMGRAEQELSELTQQIAELKKRAAALRELTGQHDQILCRCLFVELSPEAAEEFQAAARLATDSKPPQDGNGPVVSVYQNAEDVIRRLKASGKVTVVAEPRIITTSGRAANAMSGGEFPVLAPADGDQVSVEFRKFGIGCKVVPHLIDGGRIRLGFFPEIAQRDFRNAVEVNGQKIPGVTTRRMSALAEMNFGETLVVSMPSKPEHATNRHFTSILRRVNAEVDVEVEPAEKPVTLFMVTPVRGGADLD